MILGRFGELGEFVCRGSSQDTCKFSLIRNLSREQSLNLEVELVRIIVILC